MDKHKSKVSREWIQQTRKVFRNFLTETKFPNPSRLGARGPEFQYPEWMIMFIAILAVKCYPFPPEVRVFNPFRIDPNLCYLVL